MGLTRFYCKFTYNENIPKTMNNAFREPVNPKNIIKILKTKYNASPERVYGRFVKHHTAKIIEEIKNGN
jgi:hypothetical protein